MNFYCLILIIIILLFLLIKNLTTNTQIITLQNGKKYKVHGAHDDKIIAAEIFNELDRRVNILINHLNNEYKTATAFDENYKKVKLLATRYNFENMVENSPLDGTSYIENKGNKIALCIRKKRPPHYFHNINLLMFVLLHELAHIANLSYGHETDYWKTFKWLLLKSAKYNIYEAVDYSKYPENYCGTVVTYNPIFDSTI
jgi:hypothetical protein